MNIYAIIGASAIGFLAAFTVQGWRYGEQIATMQKEAAQATASAVKDAMDKTQADQKRKDDAIREANLRAQKNAALARQLDGDVNSLRQQLAANSASLPSNTCETARNYAATLSTVFQQCTERLTEVAKDADGHASDQRTLSESWPQQLP